LVHFWFGFFLKKKHNCHDTLGHSSVPSAQDEKVNVRPVVKRCQISICTQLDAHAIPSPPRTRGALPALNRITKKNSAVFNTNFAKTFPKMGCCASIPVVDLNEADGGMRSGVPGYVLASAGGSLTRGRTVRGLYKLQAVRKRMVSTLEYVK
jgi:hypothetical protein